MVVFALVAQVVALGAPPVILALGDAHQGQVGRGPLAQVVQVGCDDVVIGLELGQPHAFTDGFDQLGHLGVDLVARGLLGEVALGNTVTAYHWLQEGLTED